MNRRGFLAIVAALSPSLLLRCSKGTPIADRHFTSSVVFGHDHSITIPESAWTLPPETGVTVTTTNNLEHTHDVTVSYPDCLRLGQGDTVKLVTTSHGHEHEFWVTLKET